MRSMVNSVGEFGQRVDGQHRRSVEEQCRPLPCPAGLPVANRMLEKGEGDLARLFRDLVGNGFDKEIDARVVSGRDPQTDFGDGGGYPFTGSWIKLFGEDAEILARCGISGPDPQGDGLSGRQVAGFPGQAEVGRFIARLLHLVALHRPFDDGPDLQRPGLDNPLAQQFGDPLLGQPQPIVETQREGGSALRETGAIDFEDGILAIL